jgi:hypothetical protein
MDEFQDEFADEFAKRLREKTPVDTGALRAAWDVNPSGNTTLIGNDKSYASYVENGTEHMQGAHMLKLTLSEKEAINDKVTRELKNRYKIKGSN